MSLSDLDGAGREIALPVSRAPPPLPPSCAVCTCNPHCIVSSLSYVVKHLLNMLPHLAIKIRDLRVLL